MKDEEHIEQKFLMTWASLTAKGKYPELALLYAIPNGGNRHIATAMKLKAEGVRSGVPDLHLPVARQGFNSLYIEMKKTSMRPKRGGKGGVSDSQRWWIDKLNEQGNKAIVCYGADEAKQVIEDYLS